MPISKLSQKGLGIEMENEKRKVLLSLLAVILAAVVIGSIYYYQKISMPQDDGEGILIRAVQGVMYGYES